MSVETTKFAVPDTVLGFVYQTLVGLDRCFEMNEGQSIWFERDGDVSLDGNPKLESTQAEVKDYAANLTDNHENFWKTLKNWLSDGFRSDSYSHLILVTTQKYGANTTLKNWNTQSIEKRYEVIKEIFGKRTDKELNAKPLKTIVAYQKEVFRHGDTKIKSVLEKISITTEADDLDGIKERIKNKFTGIPELNRSKYLEGLIGFVYDCASKETGWEVKYNAFQEKLEDLTSQYCLKEFTFPSFSGDLATKEEQEEYAEKLFVQKIIDIEYESELPEAIGNWLELHTSLIAELHGFPQYRDKTNAYQRQLIEQFKRRYSIRKRSIVDVIKDSKTLFDEVIGDTPPAMSNYLAPPMAYKNGLIHDAMNIEEEEIKWRVE